MTERAASGRFPPAGNHPNWASVSHFSQRATLKHNPASLDSSQRRPFTVKPWRTFSTSHRWLRFLSFVCSSVYQHLGFFGHCVRPNQQPTWTSSANVFKYIYFYSYSSGQGWLKVWGNWSCFICSARSVGSARADQLWPISDEKWAQSTWRCLINIVKTYIILACWRSSSEIQVIILLVCNFKTLVSDNSGSWMFLRFVLKPIADIQIAE